MVLKVLRLETKAANEVREAREAGAVAAGAGEEEAAEAGSQESPGTIIEVWPRCEHILCIAWHGTA